MPTTQELLRGLTSLDEAARDRVENVAANLQLLADMGYADVTLYCLSRTPGEIVAVAEARPATAGSLKPDSDLGVPRPAASRAAVDKAFSTQAPAHGLRATRVRGLSVSELAVPVRHAGEVIAVILRELNQSLVKRAGEMEKAYLDIAQSLVAQLSEGPIVGSSDSSYATTRVAGDGIMRLDPDGRISYASPNAVAIYRSMGMDTSLVGERFDALGTDESALAEAVQLGRAAEKETYENGLFVYKRALPLEGRDGARGALAIVRDMTDLRRREQQLKVAEATIREVHHRVKNNLQTIASLLRLQARRAATEEVRGALAEAVERITSMAIVHELLANSADEAVDFRRVAEEIVSTVRQAIVAPDADIEIAVTGQCRQLPAPRATSLALVLTELVHNALRHAFKGRSTGSIEVRLGCPEGEIELTVADDGVGLPEGFDIEAAGGLGFQIVRTMAEEDLRGTVSLADDNGTTVTVRVPRE
jgi:two-component sensor histidine kinase